MSILFGGFYLFFDVVKYGVYYYAKDNKTKKIIDTFFNSVFLFFNTFFGVIINRCIINMIIRKDVLKAIVINNDNYIHSLYKMILMFIGNSLLSYQFHLIILI